MNRTLVDSKDRIIFAMDVNSPHRALCYVEELSGAVGGFKFGLEFFWAMIQSLLTSDDTDAATLLHAYRRLSASAGAKVFVDAKLDDIPNTVGQSALAISRMHPLMFNVHASAGSEAVAAAVKNCGKSLVLGVTVLTSLQDECVSIFGDTPDRKVLQFAQMLLDQDAQGIICSPQEARMLRQAGIELLLICPGIRPLWAAANDQKRVMTPGEAEREGVDYQVISRPISERWKKPLRNIQTIRSDNDTIDSPRAAAEVIAFEIAQAREMAA